jgi:hypothetical protein
MPLEDVEALVRAHSGDSRTRFVFPSSVAADHWLKEALRLGPSRALPVGRFLSWDRFKEEVVAASLPGKRPAGRELRLVFCADILSRNAEKPFLKALIPPEHRGSWRAFAPALASALPSTSRLGEPKGGDLPEVVGDYLRLRSEYASFLKARGFYEPNWERKAYSAGGFRWIIFFPELIEDFPEYDELLSSRPGDEIVVSRAVPPRSGRLRQHASLLGELRRALGEAGRAIDSGLAEPADIAFTVPGFSGLRPYIEREAALLGIPVDFRSGDSLAEYPAGRFLSLMLGAATSGFAFADLRDLLLSGGIPWREPGAVRDLVRFGLRYTVLCGWKDGGRDVDPWLATFRGKGPEWEGAERLYRGLKSQLTAFLRAADFPAIKAAWLAFSHSLIDGEAFPEELDRIFARCVVSLDALSRAQEEAGVKKIPGAFSLYLESLRRERYVPRALPGGVRFYDYRVSAGIRPKLHFILNASQRETTVLYGGCPFLREDLRSELCVEESDSSEAFLRTYAQSGERVFFSCSTEGLDGAQIPHGYFLPEPMREESDGGEGPAGPSADPESAERDFWAGEGPFPGRISDLRRAAFLSGGETFLLAKGADFSSAPCPERGRQAASSMESLNATDLSAYRECPFAWYFGGRLGAAAEPSGIESFDARFFGNALHLSLEGLYGSIASGGAFDPAKVDVYLDSVQACFSQAVRKTEARLGIFAGIVLDSGGERVMGVMRDLVARDGQTFGGYSILGIEEKIALPGAVGELPLIGRVDRLMEGPDGAWIVDYKSGKAQALKAYKPDADCCDLQFPAYALLVRSLGKTLGGALLYEGANRKYVAIAADSVPPGCGGQKAPAMSLAELGEAGGAFLELAARTMGRIEAGDFRVADPGERRRRGSCVNCPTRAVCRAHYQVR